ncbi:hypothetical protein HZC30_03790, partial [Candidatus Woesearchaeota archaeon]|nr:hypothetical protein [Candidatus Woesearchaeota archaeon]
DAALKQLNSLSMEAGFTVPKGSTHVKLALLELKQRKLEPRKFVKLDFWNVREVLEKKDGGEITRLTILSRGAGTKKGDIVEYRGDKYQLKILGKDVLLQEVGSGKKIHLKYEDMEKLKKV